MRVLHPRVYGALLVTRFRCHVSVSRSTRREIGTGEGPENEPSAYEPPDPETV